MQEQITNDANDCKLQAKYTLTEPDKLTVDLGKDIFLCKDQSVNLLSNLQITGAIYSWKNNAKLLSANTHELTIDKAGIYSIEITTQEGCKAGDEIKVEQSTEELITDFVVASKIGNNTKAYAVNIIKMPYDSVEWIVPDQALVTEGTDKRLQVSFSENGLYTIGMKAYKGRCQDILYKTVEVVNKRDLPEEEDQSPFLKRFVVSPNPNDGNFVASVELREPSNYKLYLYNNNGILIQTKEVKNGLMDDTTFNVSSASGVYFLRFVSKETISVFKVIIK